MVISTLVKGVIGGFRAAKWKKICPELSAGWLVMVDMNRGQRTLCKAES